MERRTSSETLGCGSSHSSEITLNIQTTTGGNFSITVENNNSVDQLKKIVSKKLKVSKDRICLLHRERQLRDGTLEDNGLMDGSRVILLPSVETGLLTQRPENSVMQALESLNDSQVNDFLSGKSPLNLTMRLGDHMMLIQLQLSTLNPVTTYPSSGASGSKSRAPGAGTRASTRHASTSVDDAPKPSTEASPIKCIWTNSEKTDNADSAINSIENISVDSSSATFEEKAKTSVPTPESAKNLESTDELKSFLRKQDIETLQNAFEIFKSLAEMQDDMEKDSDEMSSGDSTEQKSDCVPKYSFGGDRSIDASSGSDLSFEEQSPIKSLSNLVSSPLKSSLQPSYSPLAIPTNDKINTLNMEDKPPPTPILLPKYVPLPSSLKNNLIESIVEDQGNSDKASQADKPVVSPVITDPIAANLTSCLCSTLNPDYVCASNCHPLGHSITKIDNSNISMETDFGEEPSHLIAEAPSDEYPMENLFNNAVDQGLFNKIQEDSGFTKPSDTPETSDKKDKFYTRPWPSSSLPSFNEVSESNKNKRLHYLLHKTSKQNNPITQSKQKAFMQSVVNKQLKKKMQQNGNNSEGNDLARPSTSKQDLMQHSSSGSNHFDSVSEPSTSKGGSSRDSSLFRVPVAPSPVKAGPQSAPPPSSSISDTKALIEASKNLTQTLKKLSKEVLTSKVDLANEESARSKIGQGAVIESMKHHGKGIYSGTFSGTLNPALQDRFGRPKRDISTIIHILNDLLCATPPQYRRGARITFEPTHNTQSSRTRQREPRQQGSCSAECGCSKCHSMPGKCPYGECNGHYPTEPGTSCSCKAPDASGDTGTGAPTAEPCSCSTSRLVLHTSQVKKCQTCSGKDKDEKSKKNSSKSCRKCHSASSSLALDNSKTKCKLEQLRLVMQQKKQRREARKMKSAPYVTSPPAVALKSAEPTGIIAEEIETLA